MLLEFDELDHPIRQATADHLATIRGLVSEFAEQAGVNDPEAVACQWHILMKGSIVAAGEGDALAARRAQAARRLLLESEGGSRPPARLARRRPVRLRARRVRRRRGASSALSVFSQVKSWSSRPKWP